MKDRDKWFIIPDHHPAIIEKELFEKVQAVQRPVFLADPENQGVPTERQGLLWLL